MCAGSWLWLRDRDRVRHCRAGARGVLVSWLVFASDCGGFRVRCSAGWTQRRTLGVVMAGKLLIWGGIATGPLLQ